MAMILQSAFTKFLKNTCSARAKNLPLISGFGFTVHGATSDLHGRVFLHKAIDKTYRLAREISLDSGSPNPTEILIKAYAEFGGTINTPSTITAELFN